MSGGRERRCNLACVLAMSSVSFGGYLEGVLRGEVDVDRGHVGAVVLRRPHALHTPRLAAVLAVPHHVLPHKEHTETRGQERTQTRSAESSPGSRS